MASGLRPSNGKEWEVMRIRGGGRGGLKGKEDLGMQRLGLPCLLP